MVTSVDVKHDEASSNAAATEKDTTGTLSLPAQSDSSSEEDDDSTTVDMTGNESTKRHDKPTNNTGQGMTHSSTVTAFDIESSSPTKRRRVHSAAASGDGRWDAFVRRGARLKGFLGEAMQVVAASNVASVSDEDTAETTVMRPEAYNHAADIAREKTRECMILEKVRGMTMHFRVCEYHHCLTYSCLCIHYSYRKSKRRKPMQLP